MCSSPENRERSSWQPSESAPGHLTVRAAADGRVLGSVATVDRPRLDEVFEIGHRAGGHWAVEAPANRSRMLFRWHELIEQNRETLAGIVGSELGRSHRDALTEVAYAASFVRWFAQLAGRPMQRELSAQGGDRMHVEMRPVGLVAAITPWNAPASMVTRKVAPALAAGCPVVLKPAEATPITALRLAELALRAGCPPNLFQVVLCERPEIFGEAATTSPHVKKISFTGSTRVARWLAERGAQSFKRLSLEAGGNAPFIVLDGADPEKAADAAMVAKFRAMGQSCIAANRIFAAASVAPAFAQAFEHRISTLTAGTCPEEADIGPLIDAGAVSRIEGMVADAVQRGARLRIGGASVAPNVMAPTFLTGLRPDMRLWQEEIFGPVIGLAEFSDPAELVGRLNAEKTGLAAYVCGPAGEALDRVVGQLDLGMIGVNTGLISHAPAPFGGMRESGLGREGGEEGLLAFLEPKFVRIAE